MRQIKFKFWRPSLNEMYGPLPLYKLDFRQSNFEDFIPLQYIGLKDRNENEIYEGDIFLTEKNIIIVKFCTECSGFHPFSKKPHDEHDMLHPSYVAIIGNIYENQELLDKIK